MYLGQKYPENIGKGNLGTRGLKGDGVGSENGKFVDETGSAVRAQARFGSEAAAKSAPPRAVAVR